MKLIGRLIILLFIGLVGYIAYLYINIFIQQELSSEQTISQKEGYQLHTAFMIGAGEKISFKLANNATHLKTIIYPLYETKASNLEEMADFKINYEVTINNSNASSELQLTADFKTYKHIETGKPVHPYWYLDDYRIATSQSIVHEVEKDNKNVDMHINSEQIGKFLVRNYYQQKQSKKRVEQQWGRASSKRKDNLVRYYPFSQEQLKDYEIKNMYTNAWSSVAPTSVGETELKSISLYEYEDREQLISNSIIEHDFESVYLPNSHKYTFQVLQKTRLDINTKIIKATAEKPMALLVWKTADGRIISKTYDIEKIASIEYEQGSYELSFNQDVSFRFDNATLDHLVKLPSSRIRSFKLLPQDTIGYDIVDTADVKQSFKLTVHGVSHTNNAKLRISYFSEEELKREEILNINLIERQYTPFIFDKTKGLFIISDPQEIKITVPAGVDKLEIENTSKTILLNLYNSFDSVTEVKTVSDSFNQEYQDAWFVLKPIEILDYSKQQKIAFYLDIDKNRINPNKVVSAFEKLHPLNTQRFKELFLIKTPTIQGQYSVNTFNKLSKVKSVLIKDKSTTVSRLISPKIIAVSKEIQPFEATYSFANIDSSALLRPGLNQLVLPQIQSNQTYLFKSPKNDQVDYYLNYSSGEEDQIQKRKLYKASSQLNYIMNVTDSSQQALNLYMMSHNQQPKSVNLTISKITASGKKQVAARLLKFQNYDNELTSNLIRNLDCSIKCYLYTPQYISLPESLSAGKYEIKLEGVTGDYIDLTRTYYNNERAANIFSDEI